VAPVSVTFAGPGVGHLRRSPKQTVEVDVHQRRAEIHAAVDSVAQPEHAERNRHQRHIDIDGSRHQEWHATLDVGRSRNVLGNLALLVDEFGRSGPLAMLAEIIGGGQRVFEIQLAIDGLRHLIGGQQLGARAVGTGCQAPGEQYNQPIPVEDLRPHNQENNRAGHGDDGCERRRVDQQMRNLTAPATPDQVKQRAILVSHLTSLWQTPRRLLQTSSRFSPTKFEGAPRAGSDQSQLGYNSYMRSVNIAELKNRLSAYLQQVRAGEEIVIRDRNLPIAKIVPLVTTDVSAEELALVASGQMLLPSEPFNERAFWSIGAKHPVSAEIAQSLADAVSQDREERDAGVLGL
jgi:prevent-host-death family protein